MLLDRLLINTAERRPDKAAIVHGSSRVSYGSVARDSMRLASALKRAGLCRSDRVVIAVENSLEYAVSYFGTLLAGCAAAPVNHLTTPYALSSIISDCSPKILIARARLIKAVSRLPEAGSLRFISIDGLQDGLDEKRTLALSDCLADGSEADAGGNRAEDDLAAIMYTSGTTGKPKGVMLSHRNLYANSRSIVSYLSLTGEDSMMVVLPFYYSYGNSLLLTHVMQGGTLVLDNRFVYPNTVLEGIRREEVTGFAGVPSTFAILCHRSNFKNMSLPSLRYVTQAGGPMSHEMAFEILKTLPHVKLYIMYGQTEASARLSYLAPEDLCRKAGSVGKAIPGVTLNVLNEAGLPVRPGEAGEITAEGDNIMMGYWGSPAETAAVIQGGRLFTGDMATVDDEGYIYIAARKRDIIKSGAHRISPREIEEVILKDPGVFEAAVVGTEDPLLGEAICAFVVLNEGAARTEAQLLRLCRESLPLHKMPKHIRFINALPKTESMKVRKEELKRISSAMAGAAK